MERMREVMTTSDPNVMLDRFIGVFSDFWAKNRLLLKRIHGIAAVDPEFGQAVQARNQRRQMAATRVMERLGSRLGGRTDESRAERVALLVALTSFEFFDSLAESLGSVEAAREQLPGLIPAMRCVSMITDPRYWRAHPSRRCDPESGCDRNDPHRA